MRNMRVLRIQVDECPGILQLGLTNIAKALQVTDNQTISSIEQQFLKLITKGLSDEKCRDLEFELEGYIFVQRNSDGKTTRKYTSTEILGSDAPGTLYYVPSAPRKKKRNLTLKGGNVHSLMKGNKGGDKRQTINIAKIGGSSSYILNKEKEKDKHERIDNQSFFMAPSLPASSVAFHDPPGPNSFSTPPTPSPTNILPDPSIPLPNEDEILLHNVIRFALSSMGLYRKDIDSFMNQASKVAWAKTGRPTPPWSICEALEDIRVKSVEPGLERLTEIRRIVDAQRWFRTFLCMKRWRQYRTDFFPEREGAPLPPLGVRLGLFRKMRSSEKLFREKLYYIFTKIEPVIKKMGESQWDSVQECELLFSMGTALRTFNNRFLKKIEQLIKDWPRFDWVRLAEGISSFYLENSQTVLDLASKHQHMRKAYEAMIAKPGAEDFVDDLVVCDTTSAVFGHKKKELFDMLVEEPLQRVEYFRSMFSKFYEVTPEDRNGERNALFEAEKKLAGLVEKIELNKMTSANDVRRMEVRRGCHKVVGLDLGLHKYLTPMQDRSFIGETSGVLLLVKPIKEKEKWKSRDVVFLLFSDVAVVAQKLDKAVARPEKSLRLEDNGVVPLCRTRVTTFFNIDIRDHSSEAMTKLVVETGKDTSFELVLDFQKATGHLSGGKRGGLEWVKRIQSEVKANRQCFGRDISAVVEHDQANIPHIVKTTIETLWRKKAQLLEGIFRIAGEIQYLDQMKAMFDRYSPQKEGEGFTGVDLTGFDSFDIASLLKQWFRELPEPVMTYATYDKYIVNGNEDDVVDYKKWLDELPALNREVLLFVFGFNVELTKHTSQNKMTPANVAICWGPTILRPKSDTMSTSMLIPNVNKFVENFVIFLSSSPTLLPPPPEIKNTSAPPPAPFRRTPSGGGGPPPPVRPRAHPTPPVRPPARRSPNFNASPASPTFSASPTSPTFSASPPPFPTTPAPTTPPRPSPRFGAKPGASPNRSHPRASPNRSLSPRSSPRRERPTSPLPELPP